MSVEAMVLSLHKVRRDGISGSWHEISGCCVVCSVFVGVVASGINGRLLVCCKRLKHIEETREHNGKLPKPVRRDGCC